MPDLKFKAGQRAAQKGKPAARRESFLSADNLDIAATLSTGVFTVVAAALRLPAEVIISGAASTSTLTVWQSLRAKYENAREKRRRQKGNRSDEN
jgi:hypothetical protein